MQDKSCLPEQPVLVQYCKQRMVQQFIGLEQWHLSYAAWEKVVQHCMRKMFCVTLRVLACPQMC